jgi:integrase
MDLPPCVYRKHGGFYYVKKNDWQLLGNDLHTALQAYATIMQAPTGTMAEFLTRALTHHCKVEKLSKATVKQYTESKATLARKLAPFSPDTLRPRHVAQVVASLADKPATANAVLSFLRVAMGYAVEWQLAETNPCIGVKRMTVRKRTRYITDAEFGATHAAADARLRAVMDLCYLTGQRIGDVLAVKRADVTDQGIAFAPQKLGSSTQLKMVVRMTPDLAAAVERAKALHAVAGMTLLHDRRGRPLKYSTVRMWWDAACLAAGVEDANIHDMRAKALTDTKRQGHDAQALGGHANAAMTERYIRLRETAVVEGPRFNTKR